MATNTELIAQLYIGFYNRAPDPVGLEYWLGRMDAGVSIQDIGDSFAASPEASETYSFFSNPGSDIAGFLSQVYLNVFGRPIDDDGMAYYLARLEAGEDPGSVVTSILGNADTNDGSPDQQYIQNKVDAGLYWAEQASQSDVDIYLPNGRLNEAANDSAHGVIETVTSDPSTVAGSNGGSDDFFNPPTDGGGDGDGDTGGGGGVTVPDAEYVLNGVSATDEHGKLFAGTNNSATGFMIGKDSSGKIELGLDVRYDQDTSDVAPTPIDGNVFVVDGDIANAVRFAYSVSGIDLARYDYKLEIDTNPGVGTKFETFTLVPGSTTADPEHPEDANQSHYDWERVDGGAGGNIVDDGGDAAGTTTQNIQAIQWYNDGHGIQGGETYDVNLFATIKGTDTVVAHTGIVIQNDEAQIHTPSGPIVGDGDFLYAGQGNPNDGFATVVAGVSQIELGLGGWISNLGAADGVEGSDGFLHYALSAGSARFVYSVASLDDDMLLENNTFKLYIDTNPDAGVQEYQVFTLAADANTLHVGANNTGDSIYQWLHDALNDSTGDITDDGGDGAIGKVTQNIQSVTYFGNGPTGGGEYDIMLQAIGTDGVSIIGTNHIVLDIGPLQ